ncbi:MAG: hypothetical protein OXQ94_02550 [Gemmatimonadota bacterium]|nr:hypothetical protein [Gemmatimonadota bacterium]MDE2870560.1 hypothetical protein [Gemmatimonadota bacterium]
MKRLPTSLLACAVLLLPGESASAQNTLALLGGVNIASLDVSARDIIEDTVALRRMSVGVSLSVPVGTLLGLQFGASMAQKGGSLLVHDTISGGDFRIRANYFELTALARLGLPLLGRFVSAHLVGGPALGIETSCDVELFSDGDGATDEQSAECDEDRDTNDYGLAMGGGVEVWLSERLGVTLGVLLTRGLADLAISDDDSVKNRTLTLRGGLVLSIG